MHSLASIRAKMVGGDSSFYVKIWPKLPTPFKNADFQSIFARSASAVTDRKEVQLTRIELSSEPKITNEIFVVLFCFRNSGDAARHVK